MIGDTCPHRSHRVLWFFFPVCPRPQAASVQYAFNGLAAGRVHRTHGRVSVRGVHLLQDLPMGSAHRNSFIFILSVLVYNVSLCRVYRYKTEQGYHTSTAQLSVQYLKFIDSLFTTYEYSSISHMVFSDHGSLL